MLVLFVAYTCSFVDRQVLSLLVEPIKHDLKLSDTQISLLQGLAFALCNAIAGLPFGFLVDTKRRIPIVALGVAGWSLATTACGLTRSFGGLFLARLVVGVGEAVLTPAANSLLGDLFPPKRVGLPLAIYSLGVFAGGGLALMLGGALLGSLESRPLSSIPLLSELRPWQLVFILVGLPGLPLSLWLLSLKEPPRAPPPEFAKEHLRSALQYLGEHRAAFIWLNLAFSTIAMVGYSMAAWVPTFFIRHYAWSAQDIGYTYGLLFMFGGAAGVLSGGLIGEGLHNAGIVNARIKVVLLATSLALPCVVAFPLVNSAYWALILLGGAVYFSTFVNGLSAVLLQQMVPSHLRGLTVALSLLAVNLLGLGLGPTIVAVLTDYWFQSEARIGMSLAYANGLLLLASLVVLGLAYGPYLRTRAGVEREAVLHSRLTPHTN